jgi:hypothetical protein
VHSFFFDSSRPSGPEKKKTKSCLAEAKRGSVCVRWMKAALADRYFVLISFVIFV